MRNKNRTAETEAPVFSPLSFVAPTEFVELPSEGNGYPDGHPLRNVTDIEIKFMTAVEEDILTNQSFLKKGVAIDRFLSSVIINKNVDPNTLLVADKNAILVAARISGYGPEYEASMACPSCEKTQALDFNLANAKSIPATIPEDSNLTLLESGRYRMKLPRSGFNIEIGLLTTADEKQLTNLVLAAIDGDESVSLMSSQYQRMIKSIEGHEEEAIIQEFVKVMPTIDSRELKMAYGAINPKFEIKDNFTCNHCGHSEEVDVPVGANFFRPE
jgi:hypothetical protein